MTDCMTRGMVRFHAMNDEIAELRQRAEKAEALVTHCWVHSGYSTCGYLQMTTEEKALFDAITERTEDAKF